MAFGKAQRALSSDELSQSPVGPRSHPTLTCPQSVMELAGGLGVVALDTRVAGTPWQWMLGTHCWAAEAVPPLLPRRPFKGQGPQAQRWSPQRMSGATRGSRLR